MPRGLEEIKGKGTNELIKKGAQLVTEPEDILAELGIISKHYCNKIQNYNEKKKCQREKEVIVENKTSMSEEYIELFNFISYIPVNSEYLAQKTKLKICQINQMLTMLELEGYIKSIPGNNYVRI